MHLTPLGPTFFARFLSGLYKGIVHLRNRYYNRRGDLVFNPGLPAISVGGIQAGGTGKTPLTRLIAQEMVSRGFQVAILSRGYRRKETVPLITRPGETHDWRQIGDEPALLQHNLPHIWLGIGKDRCSLARALNRELGDDGVYILDDAFQHRRIGRSLDIVSVGAGTFDDHMIPAGTLREPISSLIRAGCICVIGSRAQQSQMQATAQRCLQVAALAPVVQLYTCPGLWVNLSTGASGNRPPIDHPAVVCGIARPQRFLDSVRECGIEPHGSYFFSDHHPFCRCEIESILGNGVDGIVTTEKDAVRLRTLGLVMAHAIWYLTMELQFATPTDERLFMDLLPSPPNSARRKSL